MARINRKAPAKPEPKTHEGGRAALIPKTIAGARFDAVGKVERIPVDRPLERLRRSVLACLLWEDEFYEDGQSIAGRIREAAQDVAPHDLAKLAVEARTTYNLRSAPMLLLSVLVERAATELKDAPAGEVNRAPHRGFVAEAISGAIQRADELTELLAIYWKDGRRPLTAQLKKGLAAAFRKFDAYQLAKYDRANAIRLRDVLFLTHAKPKACPGCSGYKYLHGSDDVPIDCPRCLASGVDTAQAALWKQLVDGTLPTPLTWETELSAGKDKRAVFERLLQDRKIGYLALLRNLRNMAQAGVSPELVTNAILERKGAQRVLPFRFVAAARAVPQYEAALDAALVAGLSELPALPGLTAVLVDVSGSMSMPLSGKSDLSRMDAAATLASVIPSGNGSGDGVGSLRVFTFSNNLVEVAARRGMAGVDAVRSSQPHSGTYLAAASRTLRDTVPYDRLIVVTDEQAHDGGAVLRPGAKGYLVNVGSYQNGVNYAKGWVHLTGFSENVLKFIAALEKEESGEKSEAPK